MFPVHKSEQTCPVCANPETEKMIVDETWTRNDFYEANELYVWGMFWLLWSRWSREHTFLVLLTHVVCKSRNGQEREARNTLEWICINWKAVLFKKIDQKDNFFGHDRSADWKCARLGGRSGSQWISAACWKALCDRSGHHHSLRLQFPTNT